MISFRPQQSLKYTPDRRVFHIKRLSIFVVGGTGSECGLPVAVYEEIQCILKENMRH